MATVPMFAYRVKGANTVIAHEGKDYREGDEVQLPKHVATNFRHQLEAVDEGGRFDDQETDHGKFMARLSTFREHEREEVLKAEKDKLESRLDAIDAELEKLEAAKRPAPTNASAAKAAPAKKTAKE